MKKILFLLCLIPYQSWGFDSSNLGPGTLLNNQVVQTYCCQNIFPSPGSAIPSSLMCKIDSAGPSGSPGMACPNGMSQVGWGIYEGRASTIYCLRPTCGWYPEYGCPNVSPTVTNYSAYNLPYCGS